MLDLFYEYKKNLTTENVIHHGNRVKNIKIIRWVGSEFSQFYTN